MSTYPYVGISFFFLLFLDIMRLLLNHSILFAYKDNIIWDLIRVARFMGTAVFPVVKKPSRKWSIFMLDS